MPDEKEERVRTQFFENQARESSAPVTQKLHVRILLALALCAVLFGGYSAVQFFLNMDKNNAIRNVEVNLEAAELRDNVAVVDLRITNLNASPVFDVSVAYDITGPSGASVAKGTVPLGEPIPPGDVRTFRHVKLTSFEGESKHLKTEISDLKVGEKPNISSDLEARYLELTSLKGDEAKQGFIEFVQKAPNFIPGYISLGRLYMEEQDYAKACETFSKAVQIDAKNADAHYNLGIALEKKGDKPGAQKELEAAYNLTPNDPDVQRAIQYMR
jgi:tetratricopeptide (TPR) repeat protein